MCLFDLRRVLLAACEPLVVVKEETEQALSWKQDSILGRTVDFELYAQYLWKQHTNWKTRPPERRALELSIGKRIP